MWYLYGTVAAGGALLVAVGALLFIQPSTPTPTQATKSAFSPAGNPFSILQSAEQRPTSTKAKTTPVSAIEDDRAALRALHEAWQERHDTLVATYVQAAPVAVPTATAPSPETPQALFSSLLGPKVTEVLNGSATKSDSQYESTSFNGEAVLWGNTAIGPTPAPITTTDTSYEIQEELRTYANTLGSTLTSFVVTQDNQPEILGAFIEDRTNTVAKERVRRLTESYTTFAESLQAIQAPSPLATNHQKLIEGYKNIGIYLLDITTASTDNELYTKLLAYNEVAGDVATYHIAVTTTLKAFGVTFAPGEAGNAFMFDGASGGASFGL